MKKSMILLGAFALLLAAPSFAQEKSRTKLKAEPLQVEKKVEVLEQSESKTQSEDLKIEKVEPKKKLNESKKIERVHAREKQVLVPAKKEENK